MADKIQFIPIGITGLEASTDFIDEEFLPQLTYPEAARVYKEMSDNDPVIGSILYVSFQLIRKAGWFVKEASESSEDLEAAQFLQQCMDDMDESWDNYISEILSMFIYGFSFHEIIYKIRDGKDSKYNDGRIGWKYMPIRSQSSLYGWDLDPNTNDVLGFIQQAQPLNKMVKIPLNKGILFRTQNSRNNPEGRSLLRNAYRPWYFKKRIEEIEGIGIERDLAGLPTLSAPEGADIWDDNEQSKRLLMKSQQLVSNIRRDKSEGAVLPFGWKLELLSTGGSRQFDTSNIINRYDQRIAITMLADIVMLGGDKVGSFALGKVKQSLLAASLESLIKIISDQINKVAVTQLFKFNNFNIVDLPKIIPGEVETPDIKDVAFILRASGLDVRRDYDLMNMIRRLLSLEPLEEDEFNTLYRNPAEQSMNNNNNNNNNNSNQPEQNEEDIIDRSMTDEEDFYEGTNSSI